MVLSGNSTVEEMMSVNVTWPTPGNDVNKLRDIDLEEGQGDNKVVEIAVATLVVAVVVGIMVIVIVSGVYCVRACSSGSLQSRGGIAYRKPADTEPLLGSGF